MEKISKEEAARRGLKRYFTGVPCIPRGHICERYVNDEKSRVGCIECHQLAQQKYRARNAKQIREHNRIYRQKLRERDPERVRQQWREWSARQKAKQTRRAAAEMENGPIS